MATFHQKSPWGKGFWIWELENCEGGNIDAIIAKCKKYGVNYLIIKTSDGEKSFPINKAPQLTREISDKLHANGISVYSWSYNYGYNVDREIALTLWALEQLGVDGHVFDAEVEWRDLPDPAGAANKLLQGIRAKHPEAFLAHAPFAYIDYHSRFAYAEFGKYCDAVMPQLYWGTIGISVKQMVADMYTQWSKWEAKWRADGRADSIKPIIPLGQTYDNPQEKFVMTPADLKEFITSYAGYGSVNFWDWQHTIRTDLWDAFRDTQVKPKSEFAPAQPNSQNNTPTQTVTPAPTPPAPTQPEKPADPAPSVPAAPVEPAKPETCTVPQVPVDPKPAETVPTSTVTAPISDRGTTTVTMKNDPQTPNGVQVKISTHKPHIEYFLEFFQMLFSLLKGKKK